MQINMMFTRLRYRPHLYNLNQRLQMSPSTVHKVLCSLLQQNHKRLTFSTTQQKAGTSNLDDSLYSYLVAHNREPEVRHMNSLLLASFLLTHALSLQILKQLREETHLRFPNAAHMAVSPEEGSFLAWLVKALAVRRAIEVGVFTGYSSLAMALSMPEGSKLMALDRDQNAMEIAQSFWQQAGVIDRIQHYVGPASESLQSFIDEGQAGQYDFAFIDADKRSYLSYYEQILILLRRGGVVAIDNVLWYGRVADTTSNDKKTLALQKFNNFLLNDPRISFSLIPVGDGLALCTKH